LRSLSKPHLFLVGWQTLKAETPGDTLNGMMRQCTYHPPTAARAGSAAGEAWRGKIYTGLNITHRCGANVKHFADLTAEVENPWEAKRRLIAAAIKKVPITPTHRCRAIRNWRKCRRSNLRPADYSSALLNSIRNASAAHTTSDSKYPRPHMKRSRRSPSSARADRRRHAPTWRTTTSKPTIPIAENHTTTPTAVASICQSTAQ
jgi:hypothetical protein